MKGSQKMKNRELPYDPAVNLTVGCISKEIVSVSQRDICTPMFIAALFTVAKTWTKLRFPSVITWINEIWHI